MMDPDNNNNVNHPSGLDIVLFLGSVREQRMATRVGLYLRKYLEGRGHTVTILGERLRVHLCTNTVELKGLETAVSHKDLG